MEIVQNKFNFSKQVGSHFEQKKAPVLPEAFFRGEYRIRTDHLFTASEAL